MTKTHAKTWIVILLASMIISALIIYYFQTQKNQVDPPAHHVSQHAGQFLFVQPKGNDSASGLVATEPLRTIQQALNMAMPGDTVILLAGEYRQDVQSVRAGEAQTPIRISGLPGAVIKGAGKGRIVEIRHSYIELIGFTIDGQAGDGDSADDYRDKLVFIKGKKELGIRGVRLLNMDLRNAADECIRIKYQARDNEVAHSRIQHCGMHDFMFNHGNNNGEAVYIGTAPEQVVADFNPSRDVDHSNNNWIHNNVIESHGSECVDIKEGSQFNLIEHNICSQQKDPNVGGISIRGNNNTIRHNLVFDNLGAGIRLGGDTPEDGINNRVYGNHLANNQGGALKLMRLPQELVCGNIITLIGDQKKVRTRQKTDTSVFLQHCEFRP